MNREIKFRAFDKEQKKFIYSDSKYGIASFWDNIYNDFTNQFEYPQEYTGLKDKSNKEIYEGDIIKQVYDAENNSYTIVEINWRKGMFNCRKIKDSKNLSPDIINMLIFWIKEDVCEVIGNIYENPELLK